MTPMLATTSLPEWTQFLLAVASVVGAVGGTWAAIFAHKTHNNIKLPSNGLSAGDALEGIATVQHYQANQAQGTSDIPSAITIGRALGKGQPAPEPQVYGRRTDDTETRL